MYIFIVARDFDLAKAQKMLQNVRIISILPNRIFD